MHQFEFFLTPLQEGRGAKQSSGGQGGKTNFKESRGDKINFRGA